MRVIALAVASLCATSALAADWPQWFGPERNGVSSEKGVAAAFTKGPQEAWRVTIGPGYASVAVVDGVVYAMTSKEGEEQVVALDAATGAETWRSRVGPFYEDSMGYHGPRATPTVTKDRVVALGGLGGLVVLDRATGARVWAIDIGGMLGGEIPKWGYSSSPLVDDGLVYLPTGGGTDDGIVALSLADGSVVWKQGVPGGAGYSSPVKLTLDGKPQVVFFTGTGLVGTVPKTGELLWRHPWTTNYEVNAATPVSLGPNELFVASGYGVGGAAIKVAEGKVTELWRTKKMKNKLATSVLVGGHLYGFNESRLTALDAATGVESWEVDGYGRGTLIVADGHLVVVGEDCAVTLVKADPKAHQTVGKPVTALKTGPCWTAPSLANGVLYVRDATDLVALDLNPAGEAAR